MQQAIHSHADNIFLSPGKNPLVDSIEEPDTQTLGGRIAFLRVHKGWSQTELATKAGIRQPSLWAIEHNEVKAITVATFLALCRALDTTWEYLWEGSQAAPDLATQESELVAIFRTLDDSARMAVLQSARTVKAARPMLSTEEDRARTEVLRLKQKPATGARKHKH